MSIGIPVLNEGTINLLEATLLNSGPVVSAALESPGTINMHGGTMTAGGPTIISPGGTLAILSGTMALARTLVLRGVLTGAGDVVVLSDGVGVGELQWLGGSMTGTGKTIIDAGRSLSISGQGLSQSSRPLEMNGMATVSAGGSRILRLGELTMGGSGSLDLNDNVIIFDDTAVSAVRGYLQTGYASGAWNGPGINSSAAANNPGMSLGLARATDLYSSFPAMFEGEQIDASAVLMKYTLAGDATWDGKVNTLDFNILAGNFGGTDKVFAQGDFNHSGVVDSVDVGILLGQYGQSIPAPAAPMPAGALFGEAGIDEIEADEEWV